jgi:hypothetical protein
VNFATRITQSIFNDLQRWRAADPAPRPAAPLAVTFNPSSPVAIPTSVGMPFTSAHPAEGDGKYALPTGNGVGNGSVNEWPMVILGDAPKGPMWHKARWKAVA